MFEHQYLIIARSSKLRQKLFEKLSLQDLRLDAVGNGRSAAKRLSKDTYDLIFFQDCFEDYKLSEADYSLFYIKAEDESDLDGLVERIMIKVNELKEKK